MKLPNFSLSSNILSFKHYCDIWSKFPSYVQIRKPEKVFESNVHGYNIDTMYNKCHAFLEEEGQGGYDSYHYCMIVIKTSKHDIFGCFVTSVPVSSMSVKFRGGFESFVFKIEDDEVNTYKQIDEVNRYYMQCSYETLTSGMGGDGSAIYLDKELFKGVSNDCETYASPVLLKDGKKNINDMFEAKNCEVYIL
jgi:hypothetical protein